MDGRIMRRGIISSCQSAATSEIVKRCCSSLCKQRYGKYLDLYLYLLPFDRPEDAATAKVNDLLTSINALRSVAAFSMSSSLALSVYLVT